MSEGEDFWDRRYRTEGTIWGEEASPTAMAASGLLPRGALVLDIGFGYGRDLVHLARLGCRLCGVEPSGEGHRRARERLRQAGCEADLRQGCFQDLDLPAGRFDGVISHRLAHLLLLPEQLTTFADKVCRVLRPGGILCLGARNSRDLDPAAMVEVEEGVYEYRSRPGHRIRYWNDGMFRRTFSRAFSILKLVSAREPESVGRPVACRLTVMVGRLNDSAAGQEEDRSRR